MKSNFDAELQLHSATETDPDPMDTRIRELTAALAEDVPPDLNKNVMKAIRAERKRDTFRRRFIRLGGAIAAALVIVPVAAVVVPVMIRQEKNMDDSPRMEDAIDTAAPEQSEEDFTVQFSTLSTDIAATGNGTAGDVIPDGAQDPAEMPEAEAPSPEATGATPAPDHMTKNSEAEDKDPTADTFAADESVTQKVQSESAVMTVLRTLIGEARLKQFAALQSSEAENPQTLIRLFDIQRQDFCRTAEALQLTFTQEELDDLFGPQPAEE